MTKYRYLHMEHAIIPFGKTVHQNQRCIFPTNLWCELSICIVFCLHFGEMSSLHYKRLRRRLTHGAISTNNKKA